MTYTAPMWLLPSLLGCFGASAPAPDDSEPSTVEIGVEGRDLLVGRRVLGPTADLLADPADGLHPPLIDALRDAPRIRVRASVDTPWLLVRKLVNSAERAGASHIELVRAPGPGGDDAKPWPPARPVRSSWRPSCPEEPAKVVGVDRGFTLQIHRGREGLWALASAKFRPLVEEGGSVVPMVDLPASCWAEPSCELLDGVGREACLAGEAGPERVELAGKWGCLLPIAKQPDGVDAWTPDLANLVDAYGITDQHDVMLIPEATVPFGAVSAVLDAFRQRGQPPPTLGELLLEGNDGPPICDIAIRDRDALAAAEGRWLAGILAGR